MSSPARGRQALVWSIKIAVSVGLLAILFSRVDFAELWAHARGASPAWIAAALALQLLMVLASAWRWGVLLRAAGVDVPRGRLLTSYVVAVFFNNFLPSNIGGDFVRIADTARPAGSKTVATLIVLGDRAIGLLGLLLVGALGSSFAADLPGTGVIGPSMLWTAFGSALAMAVALVFHPSLLVRLLQPVERVHPEWIGERLGRLDALLGRVRLSPRALAVSLGSAVAVQLTLVAFYVAVARSLSVPVSYWQLALIVPLTFLMQMLPVSLNGFGVREASFAYYFTRIGLTIEQALLVSFLGAGVILAFSLSGAVAYVGRSRTVNHGLDRVRGRP
ncbi:MAG TPA: lysylphosphatidylglycerol synthase transmembrane domain-containing protein [Vicinamibacterales bacterium]|nr:lysylphosphatidylglycerol synthase transmembrane domain-containing protein [Vicinamibacterales bacterium]